MFARHSHAANPARLLQSWHWQFKGFDIMAAPDDAFGGAGLRLRNTMRLLLLPQGGPRDAAFAQKPTIKSLAYLAFELSPANSTTL